MVYISIFGPIVTLVGVVASALFVWLSARSANKLSGQEKLNLALQKDNEVQRELTKECTKECSGLREEVETLKHQVLVLEGEARLDDLRILELQTELRMYKEQHP